MKHDPRDQRHLVNYDFGPQPGPAVRDYDFQRMRAIRRYHKVKQISYLIILCSCLMLLLLGVLAYLGNQGYSIALGEGSLPTVEPYVPNIPPISEFIAFTDPKVTGEAKVAPPEQPEVAPSPEQPPAQPVTVGPSGCIIDDGTCGDGYFRFPQKPEHIPILSWEELAPPDQLWCTLLAGELIDANGVPQIIVFEYLGNKNHPFIVDKYFCRQKITIEASNGTSAALLLAIQRTESGGGCGLPGKERCIDSKAVPPARGTMQFWDPTWAGGNGAHSPWPNADVHDPEAAALAASNMVRTIKVQETFEQAINQGAEGFLREFACSTGYPGCAVWNAHIGHARSVYTAAILAQAARQQFWENYQQ